MLLSKEIQTIIEKCPHTEKTVGFYPSFLIDPCIVPLEVSKSSKKEEYGRYHTVILTSASSLPHGHYARLIIAYLTTQIVRNPERPSYIIAHSVSDLFKQVTGQPQISGGTYANFLTTLERTFDTTFTVIPTKRSRDEMKRRGFFAETDNLIKDKYSVGQYNTKYKEVLYMPSNSFKSLIIDNESYIPIDLRFLKIARKKDIVLIHDLYIYLIRRSYKRKKSIFVPWKVLHKYIFPYLESLTPSRFKLRFIRALDFILYCHPNARVVIDKENNGIHIWPSSALLRSKEGSSF